MCCCFFPPLDSFMSCGLNFNVIVPKQHFQATTSPCCGSDEGEECRPWHSGNRRGEPRRPHLPYVIFAEVIRGEEEVQGIWERYNEVFFFFFFPFSSFFFGWGFCLDLLRPRFARTPFFSPHTRPPRALLRTATRGSTERRDPKEDKRRGGERRGATLWLR